MQAVSGVIDRITRVIGEAGGEVTKVDQWGRRRFAFEIDKQTEGFYVVAEMNGRPGRRSRSSTGCSRSPTTWSGSRWWFARREPRGGASHERGARCLPPPGGGHRPGRRSDEGGDGDGE